MEENKNPDPKLTQAKASAISRQVMPPIRQLLEESWYLLTKKVLKILLISTYAFTGIIAVYIIAALIAVITILGFAGGISNIQMMVSTVFSNPALWAAGGILFVALIVAVSIIGLMAQAALVLALSEKDETVSAFTLLKRSWQYVLPLFVVGLVEFVITFGSVFLFIIPAIIVSIFLAFTLYTVVLDKKKGLAALQMSVSIIQQQFGAIVGRFVLYFLLVIAVMIALAALGSISEEVTILVGLVRIIANFFINWFGLVFTFQIYKHARAAYDESKPASMIWMWIVSAIGWVIAALILTFAVQAIRKIDPENIMKKAVEDNKETELNIDENGEYMPGMPPGGNEDLHKIFYEQTQKELRQRSPIDQGNQI